MIDDDKEDLAALHSLDLLEGQEREQFVSELARNPELRRRVAELRQTAAALAHLAPDAAPPAELRARVLASAATHASRGGAPAAIPAPRVTPMPSWIPWLMAAGLAIGALWMQRQYVHERRESAKMAFQWRVAQQGLEEAQKELAQARKLLLDSNQQVAELSAKLKEEGDLAHFKIATLASMLGNSPEALAVAVWDPALQQGVLSVSKLPALASEKDYQLWVIDKQYPSPVNAGVFVVDPVTGEAHIVFKADKHVDSIAKFAVSLERKGGVAKAEGPIVLLSQ
ncbi:MAG: anti-sigma factor [Opitutaceae bacterium]|jgi:anti-sigma-K factor RskA